jgi:hypothetical protein
MKINITKMYIAPKARYDTDYWCDCYIEEAEYEDGTPLTDEELDKLNNDGSFVDEALMKMFY